MLEPIICYKNIQYRNPAIKFNQCTDFETEDYETIIASLKQVLQLQHLVISCRFNK